MKHNILLLSILLFASCKKTEAQKINYDSLVKLQHTITNEFLNILPGERVADIGTGIGYSLIPIAAAYPQIIFEGEDISSKNFNKQKVQKQIVQMGNKAHIEQFTFTYGNDTSTNFPSKAFDKVLLFDVLHEFTYKKEMLADVRRILKNTGVIFIGEIVVHKKQKKQKRCNYPFLTEPELKTIMEENNFFLTKEIKTYDEGNNIYLMLYEYRPSR